MTAQFGSAATIASAADGASASLAWSSGIAAGDLVLICLALGSTAVTPADPTGFTQVLTGVDVSTTLRTRLWRHVCDGSESGNIALSWSGGNASYAACALRYRYVDPTIPVDLATSNNSASAGTSHATPFTQSSRNGTAAQFWCDTSATGPQTWTDAAGVPRRALAAASASAIRFVSVLAGDLLTPAGITSLGNKTATSGISSTAFVGFTVDFTPDISGGIVSVDPMAWDDPTINLFGSPIPTTGQLWPRGVTNT